MDMIILASNSYLLTQISALTLSALLLFSCSSPKKEVENTKVELEKNLVLVCNDSFCKVNYSGPEFTIHKGEIIDTAHRMSNLISGEVGKKLKILFNNKKYAKVDLKNIRMTSIDMDNLGSVKLEIFIPFKRVQNLCEARTGLK